MASSRKMVQVTIAVLAVVWPLLLGACGAGPAAETVPGPGTAPSAAAGKPGWEDAWDRTLAAARKEGEVSLIAAYGSEWQNAFAAAMAQKFGIRLESTYLASPQAAERAIREQMYKVYVTDVMHVSATTFWSTLESRELFDPLGELLILPEVTEPASWRDGKLEWLDPRNRTVLNYRQNYASPLLINTNLVKPGEIKSYRDLLDPRWKGKIVMDDPTMVGGTGGTKVTYLAHVIMDWDFIDGLIKQEPILLRDKRLAVEWIARGKNPILFGMQIETAINFMDAGAPIAFAMPREGTEVSLGQGSIARLKNSPHPNAAKVFINFHLSKEGQTLSSRISGFSSRRVDVPTDHLNPAMLPQAGIKYHSQIGLDAKELAEAKERVVRAFQPLLR
ncbi:MAG: extracellular solute-binding protein [Chloroflexi bacterium]|nr:extracellular solute-binding protein [Chloroflexota bacterium]